MISERIYGTIVNYLHQVEKDHVVKILYACETGSRAWGFPSKDSDYDIRFIYIHPFEWYLSIDKKRDVIELFHQDRLFDFVGWDITKALIQLKSSNPPLLEWLQSPYLYLEQYSVIGKVRDLAQDYFSPKSCLYHYLNIAENNYEKYIGAEMIQQKRYFYILRALFACKWIEKTNTIVPMEFGKLFKYIDNSEVLSEVDNLLERKLEGDELDLGPQIPTLNEYNEHQIRYYEDFVNRMEKTSAGYDKLSNLFINALREVWHYNTNYP